MSFNGLSSTRAERSSPKSEMGGTLYGSYGSMVFLDTEEVGLHHFTMGGRQTTCSP